MATIQFFVKQNIGINDKVETNFYRNKVKENLISALQPLFHSTIYFSHSCGLLKNQKDTYCFDIRVSILSRLRYMTPSRYPPGEIRTS